MDDTNELDVLLKQMYRQLPVPQVAPVLARRARERATALGRAELSRISRLRRWTFAVTVVAVAVIAWFTSHVALASIDVSTWFSTSTTSTTTSSVNEFLLLTAATAAAAMLGVILLGPVLASDE